MARNVIKHTVHKSQVFPKIQVEDSLKVHLNVWLVRMTSVVSKRADLRILIFRLRIYEIWIWGEWEEGTTRGNMNMWYDLPHCHHHPNHHHYLQYGLQSRPGPPGHNGLFTRRASSVQDTALWIRSRSVVGPTRLCWQQTPSSQIASPVAHPA